MTEVISILALFTSVMLLIVHYKNQIERRHGEITRLRSDFLNRLATTQQRLRSVQMHLETARMELRHIPDCDYKYEEIEKMPKLIEKNKEVAQGVSEIKDALKYVDTTKSNNSNTLFMLQSMENRVMSLEANASELEKGTLSTLEFIRATQEQEEKQC